MSRYDVITEIHKDIDHIEHVEKFNPYHDSRGRFASASGYASFTFRTKDPKKQHMADMAIAREKERNAATVSAPKQGLVNGLGREHAEKIEALVSNAPDFVKNAWNKYGDEVTVASNNHNGLGKCDGAGRIFVNIENDSKGQHKEAYETTMHESGHSIDRAISRNFKNVSYRFSEDYKDGLFEKTLVKEADAYVKNKQKQMSEEKGYKVKIGDARSAVSRELMTNGLKGMRDVSDMFEGATKGKVTGIAGHGKAYWTGRTFYGQKIPGKSVALEAFAEMFSATITNPASLENIKKYFPESYGVFTEMLGGL